MPATSHVTKPTNPPTRTSPPPTVIRSTRFSNARIVLALALVGPLAFGIAFAGLGFFSAFPPVVIGSVVCALVAAAVLAVGRRWMAMVGAVAAGLMLALATSDPTPGSWVRPSLGLQMSWGHAARLAGLVGLFAGLVEFRQARRAVHPDVPRTVTVAAAVALGLAVGIGGTTTAALADDGLAASGAIVAVEPDATVRMVESEDRFVDIKGSVSPGQLVLITIENRDDYLHGFTTTDGPDVDVDNLGSKTTEILARAPASPGPWHFVCKYHPGMEGEIQVTEA